MCPIVDRRNVCAATKLWVRAGDGLWCQVPKIGQFDRGKVQFIGLLSELACVR